MKCILWFIRWLRTGISLKVKEVLNSDYVSTRGGSFNGRRVGGVKEGWIKLPQSPLASPVPVR